MHKQGTVVKYRGPSTMLLHIERALLSVSMMQNDTFYIIINSNEQIFTIKRPKFNKREQKR